MAIVVNRARGDTVTDRAYCSPSRTNAGTPNAVLTPAFAGEIIFDTTNKVRWRAIGIASSEWIPMEAEVT